MNEGYPKNWKHCIIHLDPETGEMHSDGDHSVRHWIKARLAPPPPKTLRGRIKAAWKILRSNALGQSPTAEGEDLNTKKH